jgi:5-methylcytosine-specific restriction endonuclease McrA
VNQSSTIAVLHFINDCERRKSYLDLGYSSVFSYCVRKFEYSSSTAGRYIQAARCIREHREVLPMLEKREVSVTTVCQVASILTEDNKRSVLGRVKGAPRHEVERIACQYRPPQAFRDLKRPVRVASMNGAHTMVLMQYLASDAFADIFDEVRELRRGDESFGETSEVVFREYLDRHSPIARQERRAVRKGAASPDSHRWECEGMTNSRHIPDEVGDAVWVRDGGQCAFVAADGTRRTCRKGLQVDHIRPFANRGTHEPSNLRLLCGAHNRRAAERAMGADVMKPFWRLQ